MNNSLTTHVFLCDIDFLPMVGLYEYTTQHVRQHGANVTKQVCLRVLLYFKFLACKQRLHCVFYYVTGVYSACIRNTALSNLVSCQQG
jgi:hypothetical protein